MAELNGNTMKKVYQSCILFLFSLISFSCAGQAQWVTIKVLSEKGDKIQYQVKNETNQIVYYYVGLEVKLEGSWQETITDIAANAPEKGAVLLKLAPMERKMSSFSWIAVPKYYKLKGMPCRFRLVYGKDQSKMEDTVVYSAPFVGK